MSEAQTGSLRVEALADPRALADLAGMWDDLLAASDADALFLTWTWISTWWEVFGAGRRLHVLTAHDAEGALVGIAPLMVQRGVEGFPARLRVLMVIGQQGETLAERLDLIVQKGREDEVVGAFVAHLLDEQRALFDVLFFERVREDSTALAALRRCLGERGLSMRTSNEQPSPYRTLPASYEELRASMSRNFRRQLSNARNRLEKKGAVQLHFAPQDIPVAQGMDTLIALHRARWGPDEGSFRTPAYLQFHHTLSERLAARGELVLVLLGVGDETVAGRYDFLYGGRVWCFQGGWEPTFERMRVGTVLTAEVLRWAIEQGGTEYDFLSGDDPYKRRWADDSRTLVDLRAWGRGPRAWAHYQTSRARALARRLLRRDGAS